MNKSIGRMITLLGRKSQLYLGGALQKYNLSAAEQPFFMALQSYEGLTQEELTAIVCVDKAATARAVKSLEEKGYLIRIQDKQDRRQNRIYATEAAKQLAASVREELFHFNDLLTQGIEPPILDCVYKTLLQMEENLYNLSKEECSAMKQEGQSNGTSDE